MSIEEKVAIIEHHLRLRVRDFMAEFHPGVEYELDVFDSDNGEDDWEYPLAASLKVPDLFVEDAYGLCDAGSDTIEQQVEFLFGQIVEEFKSATRKVFTDSPNPTLVVISTGHITEKDDRLLRQAMDGVNAPFMVLGNDLGDGWFLYVPDEPGRLQEDFADVGFSFSFWRILKTLRREGIDYVRFDRDGPEYEGLPSYDW